MKKPTVVLIGAGNLGQHLGQALAGAGMNILQVFSRHQERAEQLSKKLGTEATTDLYNIFPGADVYLLAVPDDAIRIVAGKIKSRIKRESLVAHCSGATPSTILEDFNRYGVFYPLQTFSVGRAVDFSRIPICVYANTREDTLILQEIGQKISQAVHLINDEQRSTLHVAAVLVNNFSNHLFEIGRDIVESENLPFDLLKPLILATAEKVQKAKPIDMQTGPAQKEDINTIEGH